MSDNKLTLGFIGVGVMGRPIAQHLLAKGHTVLAYDKSEAAVKAMVADGATAATSIADVVDRATIVFTSLPSPAIFTEVAEGAGGVHEGKAVKIMVDLSTVGSRATRHAAAALLEKGIDLVDAPVSGGAAGAQKGTLAIMAAGRPEAVSQVRELLESFGKVFLVGPQAGQAQLLKLLNNMLSSTAFAITSEAFVAGVKGGLDPEVMMAAINAGSGRSGASQDKFMKQVMPRSFDFGFPISSVCKDIGLAVEECEALGVPMWVGNTVRQLWNFAGRQDGMQRDMTELVRSIEQWTEGGQAPRSNA
ncbi:MAG: NAD(P)-dependent oxidoreductase [Gammaproteobacteria bacterium]|nr:NAD(P)-dependent oxidoreductase [Gammaproteobacteria bacterium]MBU1440248.1 NAD(P)-dependent oxidoreductase [Gammaproteobacteria bacterium]MBU2408599.1 NAD(P)-dependent oxidoreductase [Gammaproteobacteria bacterium]